MIDNLSSTINSNHQLNHGFNCPSLDLRVNSVAILGTIAATKVVNKSDLPFSESSLSTVNCSQLLSSQSINETLFSDFNDDLGEESPNESGNFEYVDLTQVNGVCLIFILLYSMVILFSILGNIIVACTVICNRKMQTVVNYYIVNLAFCDFLIGFFVAPIKLIELTVPASWSILNDNLCTALNYLQTVIVFTSVLTLVAICFERYFAVVHPLRSRVHQSKSRTIKILHGVWYIPLVAAGPFLMPSKAYPNRLTSPLGTIERLTCFVNFSPAFRAKYYTCLFIFFYLIPLLFIGWTCFQIARCLIKQTILQREGLLRRQEVNRRKVAKMILVVVFAFTISWTPYFLVSIVTQYQEVNFMTKHNYFFTMLCINLFAFLNSSINPLIYVLMSTRFRLGFTNILRLMLCISSHEELEDSDRIVSGDQHHNHNNLHGQANNSQQSTNQSQQLTRKNENDDPSKVKSLTHMAKYRHRLVMFICGQVSHLSTDSGHSESSPPVSGCLPDKPTEKLDKTDPGKRSDGIKIESKAESLLINGSNLTSNVPQVNNCLPSITVSTHLQQPNVTSLGLSPNSVASSFIPHLIQSDCTDGSGETQGITLNDSRFSKRRYSDNFLFAIKFDNNPLNESETGNNDNKLINNPLDKEHSLASNKLSTQICLNVDDSPNNNLNNDYQSGQINYNRSKSEPHFITSTQL